MIRILMIFPSPPAFRLQGEGKMQGAIVGMVWPQIAG